MYHKPKSCQLHGGLVWEQKIPLKLKVGIATPDSKEHVKFSRVLKLEVGMDLVLAECTMSNSNVRQQPFTTNNWHPTKSTTLSIFQEKDTIKIL